MKKKVILAVVSIAVLSGCTVKKSNEVVNSKSTNASVTESTVTESLTTDNKKSNYTLAAIREMAEQSESLDIIIPNLDNLPDNYNILAEPSYQENTYSFVGGSTDNEPVIDTDDKKDIEKYTLSKNSDAASVKEVRQLIEKLKQQRTQDK